MHISRTKQRNFTRDLVSVFFLLSLAVLGSVAFISSRAREEIPQKFIDNTTVSAVRQFETMVNSITQSLELALDRFGKALVEPCQGTRLSAISPAEA
jgi:hypothetical protein